MQRSLEPRYQRDGVDPEDMRCRTCGLIWDGGHCCCYCGDPDPIDEGVSYSLDEATYVDELMLGRTGRHDSSE